MWVLPHSQSCLCLKLDDGKKKKKNTRIKWSWNKAPEEWLWWKMNIKFNSQGVSGVDVIRKFKSTRQINSSFPTSLLESQTFSNLFCPFALAPLLLEIPSFSSSSHSERSIFFTNLSQLLSFLRVTTAVSVQFIHSVVSNSVTQWNAAHQASLSFTIFWSLFNSYPLNQWSHPTISFSVIPFFSCPQSFPASGSFPMSHPFTSGVQSIGASASVLQWLFRVDFL